MIQVADLRPKAHIEIQHVDAEPANTKGATYVTPFAYCFATPVKITLKQRV
jgi:hypothetical protein